MNPRRRTDLVIALLVAGLLLAIGLSLVIFSQARQYYLQLNATRLDPLGLTYYPSSPKEQPAGNRLVVVFLGDSRAASWPAPVDLPQFEFINRGIGAQTSAQVLHRFEAHIEPLKPDIVIIQVGINDLKTIPLFPQQKERIIADCQANIQEIVNRSVKTGATVILTTVFPVARVPLERRLFWSPEVASAVVQVNNFLYTLESEDVIIFDTYSLLTAQNGVLHDKYAHDLLHLNPVGYEALNQELSPLLQSLSAP